MSNVMIELIGEIELVANVTRMEWRCPKHGIIQVWPARFEPHAMTDEGRCFACGLPLVLRILAQNNLANRGDRPSSPDDVMRITAVIDAASALRKLRRDPTTKVGDLGAATVNLDEAVDALLAAKQEPQQEIEGGMHDHD